MAKQVTQYSILLSCPSDVKDELNVVNDTVTNFNRLFGEANSIDLKVKHWSTHTYPESGGKPQDLLNNQIVRDSDAAIAVFWTRFGTPTDNYGSGTEEEIEELIKMGKQVFVYFSDRSISPSEYNPEEHKRVEEFKKKYKDMGIYWTYKDIDEFKQLLTNHVSMYFMKLVSNNGVVDYADFIDIKLLCVEDGKTFDHIIMKHSNYSESKYCIDTKDEISQLFIEIHDIKLHNNNEIKSNSITPNENNESLKKVAEQIELLTTNPKFFNQQVMVLSTSVTETIKEYYQKQNQSKLDGDFFNLGNLEKRRNIFGGGTFGTSPTTTISGTDNEKQKYNTIMKLYSKIIEYNDAIEYFLYLDSLYWFNGVIANVGKNFDEDVDITIYIEKGCLVKPDNLKLPGGSFLEMINSAFEYIFRPKKTSRIEEYADYPIKANIPTPPLPLSLYGKSLEDEIEENKDEYKEHIENTFVYEVFEEEKQDVIKFNLSYIKHSTNIYFPSFLLFDQIPSKISYDIISKHSTKTINGELIRE